MNKFVIRWSSLLLVLIGAFSQANADPTANKHSREGAGTIQFTTQNASAIESAGQVTITLTREGGSDGSLSVNYKTRNGSADLSDYSASDGTVTFDAGVTSGSFTISISDDNLDEDDETVIVDLTGGSVGSPSTLTLTIQDDDPLPTLSINDVSLLEGNSGKTSFAFTVSLSSESGRTVSVDWGTESGTAEAGGDYDVMSSSLDFLPGERTKQITVDVIGDDRLEGDETFFVVLGNGKLINATLLDGRGVGTIQNDDTVPLIATISDGTLTEGDSGTLEMIFTVKLSEKVTQSGGISVHYSTASSANGNGAIAGIDYVETSNVLKIARNFDTGTIKIPVFGDNMYEVPQEIFLVSISSPSDLFPPAQATGTINDNDPVPTISITGGSLTEGNSGTTVAPFVVTLSNPSYQQITVNYATSNGTATAGTDYIAQSGQLVFASGEVSKTIQVLVNGDANVELDEYLLVNLSNPSGASIAVAQSADQILNDDTCPAITMTPSTIPQASVGTAYNQTFVANGGSAPYTYVLTGSLPAGLTFGNGTVSGVPTSAGQFTFTVTATDANGCGGTLSYSLDVKNLLSISINSISVTETNSSYVNATLTVTLSAASTQTVSVKYATQDGTAKAGYDYLAANGTLTFAPGTTSMALVVKVNGDRKKETNETFSVNLSTPVNCMLGASTGVVTIVNDDGLPKLWIAGDHAGEGNNGTKPMVFTVRLDKKATSTVTVDYATANGSALAGSDYTAASGTLTFAAGETEKKISVGVIGDLLYEPQEYFTVRLSNQTGAKIQDGSATGSIHNDDSKPELAVSNAAVDEGNSGTVPATFTVSLSNPSSETVTVYYATDNGSACPPSDYVSASGKLTFNPGVTAQSFIVSVNGDVVSERNEEFYVRLSRSDNASIHDAVGTCLIRNDDAPSISSRFDDLIAYIRSLPAEAFRKTCEKSRADLIDALNDAKYAFLRGSSRTSQCYLKDALKHINETGYGGWIVQEAVRQDIYPRVLDLSVLLDQAVSTTSNDESEVESTEDIVTPMDFGLAQNYPNPFNPTTTIQYTLREPAMVSLKVYDMVGREVANLVQAEQGAGQYSVKFDGERLTSGTYIYRIQAGSFTATKKLILTK